MGAGYSYRQEDLIRLLVYVLGVSPQEFYLVPNAQGWVSKKELLRALEHDPHSPHVRESSLQEAAAVLAPDQLEITSSHIRAKNRRPLPWEYAVTPPGQLFYGTKAKTYAHVLAKGLQAGEQGALILSPDQDLALRLAKRRGPETIMLTVQARKAYEQGVVFDLLGTDMYLCQYLDARFLMGPALPETPPPKTKKTRPLEEAVSPFIITPEASRPYKQKGLKKEIRWKKERRKSRHGQ
jgi:putative RNA 2'-phosphotransferase